MDHSLQDVDHKNFKFVTQNLFNQTICKQSSPLNLNVFLQCRLLLVFLAK